jgi:putative peptidoglycan lipid II flippase
MSITWLGATWLTDAFQIAFFLPNLFRRLFGEGVLSAAFIPVFTDTFEKSGRPDARRLLANALGLLAALLSVLMLLCLAGLLIWVWRVGAERPDRQYLVLFAGIMLPFMVLVCMLALASAALNCRGRFAYPAAAPIILNLCMIAADWVAIAFWPGSVEAQLTTICASVSVAGVIQVAGVFWLLRSMGLAARPRLRPVEPGIGKIVRTMAPALIGAGFLQISSLFDYATMGLLSANQYTDALNIFGWEIHRPLEAGVVVKVIAANRLATFPMGVFALSLGAAVFPLLSRYASRGDMLNLRDSLNRACRLAVTEGLATGVGMFMLAGPIVQLIYRHRGFTAADAQVTTRVLQFWVVGMWAFCLYPIMTRAFYSMKDTKTPLKIAACMSVLYMTLVVSLVFVPAIGPAAFGIVPSVTFGLNVLVMFLVLRKRIGRFGGRRLAASAARSAVAAGAMAAVLYGLRWLLGPSARPALAVALGVPLGAGIFVLAAYLLRAPELGELMRSFRPSSAKNKTAAQDYVNITDTKE